MHEILWLGLLAIVVFMTVLWPVIRQSSYLHPYRLWLLGTVILTVVTLGGYSGIGIAITQPRIPDLATAVQRMELQLRQQPDNLTGWLRLAQVYTMADRPTDAVRAYHHILSRDPEQLEARTGLATEEMRSGDPIQYQRGVQRFEAILQQHANHPETLWMLGMAAVQEHQFDKAKRLWQQLLQQLTPNTESHQMVTQALRELPGSP